METVLKAQPLVSIVIPAYNAAETLAETLASAAAQTYRPIEIIVVDDGSTDTTAQIATEFCNREPCAKVIQQENRGVCAARNAAIAQAAGEFIAPLDADDLWHPEKIARQVAAAYDGAAFVYSWSRDIDMAGNVWRDGPQHTHIDSVFLRMLAENFVGNGSALLVRRDAALAVGGYDETMRADCGEGTEDILFQLKLAERFRAAVARGYLVGYRRRANSVSANLQAMFRSWRGARARLDFSSPAARLADRWGMARRRLLQAEGLARRAQWRPAIGLLSAAIARDPHRSLLTLSRLTVQALSPKTAVETPVQFYDMQPDEGRSDGDRGDALARLDARRMARLAKREALLSD